MRDYPYIYSQRDPAWASLELGTMQGATIGQYGCLLTCHTMKAGYYGHQITPHALNDIYIQRNLYLSGDLLSDADLHAVFGDILLVDARSYTGIPADLAHLKQLAQDPNTTVTIEVDFDHNPNDGVQTHFVELHEYDGTTLTIFDPWYGTVDNFSLHYGTDPATTIQKIAVYTGTPISPNVSVDAITFQKLVTNSTSYDSVCDEVGEPHNTAGAVIIADIAKLKIDKVTAEQTVGTLNQQLPALKLENETLTGQIETLKTQLQDAQTAATHPDTGSNYKDLYNQAESDLIDSRKSFGNLQQTYNRAMGQYQNTSVLLIDKWQLMRIAIARLFGLPVGVTKGGAGTGNN